MKRLLLIFALVFSLVAPLTARPAAIQTNLHARSTAAALARTSAATPASELASKMLANGLEIIVLEDHSVPVVTIELAVRNGSFTEPPELNGLSHLYEHMFFKPNKAVLLMQCEDAGSGLGLPQRCNDAMTLKPQIGDVGYLRNLGSMGLTYNGSTHE